MIGIDDEDDDGGTELNTSEVCSLRSTQEVCGVVPRSVDKLQGSLAVK